MFSIQTPKFLQPKLFKFRKKISKTKLIASQLEQVLKSPAQRMSGIAAIKTRYRAYICPLDLVLSAIPQGSRLFDIGCGTGALLYLALKLKDVEIAHGYDISVDAVKASTAFNADPTRFKVFFLSPENTPSDISGYNTITMVDVLHHLPIAQQDSFIYKVVQNMTPGSQLILKDIEAAYILGSLCNQIHDLILAREWVHHRRSQDILKVMRAAGLKIEYYTHQWTLWYPHFQIVATKSW